MLDIILVILAAVAVVLLIMLLTRKKTDHAAEEMLRGMEVKLDLLKENIDRLSAGNLEQASAQRQEIMRQFADLSNMNVAMQARLSESNEKGYERLRITVEERLKEMQKTVDEKLHESLKTGLETSFARVSEQLSELYKTMGEVKTLTTGVGDLKKILSNVKNRGTWGEIQLSRLLEDFMAPGQYEQNARINNDTVEFAILLPGEDKKVLLPIDSKFPMDRFTRVQDTEGEEHLRAEKELARAIMDEGKKINEKYIHPPITTDFAVMFLPSESLYAEVIRLELLESLQNRYKVMVTGPSTLSALLTSLQTGFKTMAIREHSMAILDMLNAVKNEFDKFEEYIEKTRHSLQVAQGHLENASRRGAKIQNRLTGVSDFKRLE